MADNTQWDEVKLEMEQKGLLKQEAPVKADEEQKAEAETKQEDALNRVIR